MRGEEVTKIIWQIGTPRFKISKERNKRKCTHPIQIMLLLICKLYYILFLLPPTSNPGPTWIFLESFQHSGEQSQTLPQELYLKQWVTSLSLFTFMHWRRKWQPTPVFLPGESQGWQSLVGCHLWDHTESDTTEATRPQQQVANCFPWQNFKLQRHSGYNKHKT